MEKGIELRFRDRFGLFVQRFLGWITFPAWGTFSFILIRFIGRYRVERLCEIRRQFQELVSSTHEPVLLCANHLTKIDSALIMWSLGSLWSYFRSFRIFSWNLPERKRYFGNFFLRLICYLGSCIPVDRGGERSAINNSLQKICYLLQKGHVVTIFPEGKRSLEGKIDVQNYSYGIGKLIETVENCKVVCIYLRGYGQKTLSSIPRLGEKIYVEMKLIQPKTLHHGIRATRDLAKQVIDQLHTMEEEYFALCR